MGDADHVELSAVTGGVVLFIRAQPGARRTEVTGVHDGALKVRIAAPPVDDRANDALVAFLAKAFGLRRSSVTIRSGSTSRRKRIKLDDVDLDEARAVLAALLAA